MNSLLYPQSGRVTLFRQSFSFMLRMLQIVFLMTMYDFNGQPECLFQFEIFGMVFPAPLARHTPLASPGLSNAWDTPQPLLAEVTS